MCCISTVRIKLKKQSVPQLGLEWGEKKSICNKFLQSNAGVTCITWPLEQVKPICLKYLILWHDRTHNYWSN